MQWWHTQRGSLDDSQESLTQKDKRTVCGCPPSIPARATQEGPITKQTNKQTGHTPLTFLPCLSLQTSSHYSSQPCKVHRIHNLPPLLITLRSTLIMKLGFAHTRQYPNWIMPTPPFSWGLAGGEGASLWHTPAMGEPEREAG